MVSIEELKIMLEVQQNAYKDVAQLLFADISTRMKQLEQRNQELVHSLEFTQGEVDVLKKENKTLKEDIAHLKNQLNKATEVENKIHKINDRLDYQEDYSRRNNLRFDGVDEKARESWEETQETVQRVLREKLNLGTAQLERAHRVGPPGLARPRTIVARFREFADRQQGLRNSSRLKNTNIYVNEDLCESSNQLRKAQLPQLKKARAEGKVAYFSHTKLIIKERSSASGDSERRPGSGEGGDGSSAAAEASVNTTETQPQSCPTGGPTSKPDEPIQDKDQRGTRSKRKIT